ncbi:hypothetical protein H0H10_30790 [Streptomyces sp. TRM S81-3]|uniref:Uncharacterized protein n=1 Tax=Streptomyces griseicoloratus TaxID=2752516 RepID=A0A926LBA9_9ACTN|nr:hypothetical protein [Streptomyces griseicoloratus]MBD0423492.1 hypothetical protein [Streptomyces griseicoloratus]
MIRIVTAGRMHRLEQAAEHARDRARDVQGQADAAWGRHVREVWELTARAERAEATTSEVGTLLARAVEEVSAAQQELLLKDIEIRRLREQLRRGPVEGDTLTVLMHYGEPHTVYASREDAYADTATHGVPAGTPWVPAGERPASASTWCIAAFIYDASCNGFRRAFTPAPKALGEAA